MKAEVIEVDFTGKDYSRLRDSLVIIKSKISKTLKEFIENHKTEILKLFLDKVDVSSLAPNHSTHYSKQNNTEYFLYRKRENELFYDGLAGVIAKKNFKLLKSDIDPNTKGDDIVLTFNIKLVITSRFDVGEKPYFLSTMLLRDGIKFTDDTIPSSMEKIYEYLLIFIYKKHLEKALIKGFYKEYKEYKCIDDKIKGTIDIPEYIRRCLCLDDGEIPYRYKKNSYSNNLNQLIVAAYLHLRNKHLGIVTNNFDSNVSLRKSIELLQYLNPKINSNVVINNKKPIIHPFYTEYEDLRRTCLQIMRNDSISIGDDNEDNTIKGFVFYLPDLWEMFLEDSIKKRILFSNITISVQGGSNGIKVLEKNGLFILPTYPDFVININGEPKMILDAKFRPVWDNLIIECKEYRPGNLLDDYTKCIRDMNTIDSKATGVIYPTNIIPDKEYYREESIKHRISKYNKKDLFYVFPIPIPISENYASFKSWKVDFEKHLTAGVDKIISVIKKYEK